MNFRILTFNWHEGYLHLLAKTGYEFDIVEVWKGDRYGWTKEFRPVPPNCRLITCEEAIGKIDTAFYDRIICHNLQDLSLVSESPIPKILLHHNKLQIETNLFDREKQEELLETLRNIYSGTKNLTFVFVSKAKKDTWGIDGEVILPAADPKDYNGYRGDIKKVLRIGNYIKQRGLLLGYSCQEEILNGVPSTALGINPDLPDGYLPKHWEEYKEFLRSHRLCLHTTTLHDDGYNLSLLEAMVTGMPIVCTAHPTSPIENEINGYTSSDQSYLSQRIEELLQNHQLAKRLGQRARETILEKFPLEDFIKNWRRVLGKSTYSTKSYTKTPLSTKKSSRLRILMSYVSNPQTTAFYIEKALRKHHDVITYGPTIGDEILEAWDLKKIKNRLKDHDIPYFTPNIKEVVQNLPTGWTPDLFLWIESGVTYALNDLEELPFPSACYLIDTHLHLEEHIQIAKHYDFVFIAQREYLTKFKEAGIQRTFWIPLGCDPEIHGKKDCKKLYDIGFVGSLNYPRRINLINILRERFNLHYERCFLERMAEVFSESKIIFNNSVNNDLNMRVFEALCSGSMLITDEAKGSGLTEIFQDRKHLVIYNDEIELLELAEYYLKNENERKKIAGEGEKEVLSKHTYEHRIKEMIDIILQFTSDELTKEGKKIWDTHPAAIALQPYKTSSNHAVKNTIVNADEFSDKVCDVNQLPTNSEISGYYAQERHDVESIIPRNAVRILDVGCGEGILGKRILERGAEEVVGIEIKPDICERASENLTRAICGDVEEINLPFEERHFDCIVLADILEHLKEPLITLEKLGKYLSDTGTIVASIHNVRFRTVINMLVEGRWKYEDYGILDKTHLRFFTKKEIQTLFTSAGLEIQGITENIDPAYYSLEDPLAPSVSFGRISLSGLDPDELKDLFVFQYLIKAQKAGYEIDNLSNTIKAASESDNFDGARVAIENYLELHPGHTDILLKHAEVCSRLDLLDKARRSLEKILIFEPERQDALNLRKEILEELDAKKAL